MVLGGVSHAALADQVTLQKVKDLYAAAAYEEALGVLNVLPEEKRTLELNQYRAFCFIALGQQDQAQDAIEAVLAEKPLYLPDPAETSPRVIEAFTEARDRIVPALARRLYSDAKSALERKNREAAIEGFQSLIGLLEGVDPPVESLEDMKVLAAGFLDLSKALPEASPADAARGGNGAAETAPTATIANGDADGAANGTETKSTDAVSAAATRPVAIKQDLPPWAANDAFSRRAELTGTLRVRVGADGRVESAELIRRIHPAYDSQLLRAARTWLYQPATQNGVPVAADVIVEIRLRPQAQRPE
jgi:TonB family protein